MSLNPLTNYDEIFIRDVTLGIIMEFNRKIRWVNRWDNSSKLITIPVYYSLANDSRFLMDSFIDDIIGTRPDFNSDPIPRAMIYLDGVNIKTDEYTNPYVNLQYTDIQNGVLKRMFGKFRHIPVELTYKMSIRLSSEGDYFKCIQSIMDWLWPYSRYSVDYKGMKLSCRTSVNENFQVDINRQFDSITNNVSKKQLDINIPVHTYYLSPFKENKAKPYGCVKKVLFKGTLKSLDVNTEPPRFIGDDSYIEYKKKRNEKN